MQHMTESPKSYDTYSSLVDAQYAKPDDAFVYEADRQAQLNDYTERQYQDWPKSSYTDVNVLLLRWAEDNLNVITEVKKLEKIWRDRFNFTTEIWDIPSDDSEQTLVNKILQFRRGISKTALVILYYAGHGGYEPHRCMWYARNDPYSPRLNWYNVQALLLGYPPNVLMILDCCFAGLAVTDMGEGDNWFLGATVKEAEATGVSWKSFTSAMSRQLELAANEYWSHMKTYNVQTLKHDLNIWERHDHLPVSPDLIRLTAHDCPPTDLTPLIYRRQRPKLASANTEPVAREPPQQSPTPIGRRRPPQSHATLPPQPPSSTMNLIDHGNLELPAPIGMVPIEISIQDTQTLRITGLPWDAGEEDVRSWFKSRMALGVAKVTVGPVVGTRTSKMAIVTFPNIAVAKLALQINRRDFPDRTGQHTSMVVIDSGFQGFTTIYSSTQAPSHEPNVDIVLVHDVSGHPFNSFASHHLKSNHGASMDEKCWPRDELPGLLEARGVFPRILTYGWPAGIWLNPQAGTHGCTSEFISRLNEVRVGASKRPLVFIGHGLGGIMIKDAVNNIVNASFGEDDPYVPVKASFFLAVPHREAAANEGFAQILTSMGKLGLDREQHPAMPVRNLSSRDGAIQSISIEFEAIASEYGINTVTVGESVQTLHGVIVPEASSSMTEARENHIAVDGHYRDVARLPPRLSNRQVVLDRISDSIVARVVPRRPTKLPKGKEKVFARLKTYDTFFLVDDSGSMRGNRWRLTSEVLAEIASIAVEYDRNGVDVKFFNEPLDDGEGKNLTKSEEVMDLFSRVTPDGTTLTADVLDEVLSDYMYELGQDRQKKSLNLIVLTDGEPEPKQDVEEVIVRYAKQLRDARVHPLKVGIQFVQIGNDPSATKFLKFLDDNLKGKHGLDRDMVDTVRWVPGEEATLSEKILLGGILKRYDDDDKSDSHD
ncbi:MAG: hypothetical protein Q9202_003703 [Teloschistes flavicans]